MACLPTPPSTSHRDKENTAPRRRSVFWAEDQVHLFRSGEHHSDLPSPNKSYQPTKSILKPARPLQPSTQPKERESTPQPENALANASFLQWPISRLLAPDASLRDLTEAWNVLNSRIRDSVAARANGVRADSSRPLFRPLKKHAAAIADAVVRDLQRVLVDPWPASDFAKVGGLPSPGTSPKKRGMSADQVKHARDLCTVSQAVIKFLNTVFNMEAVRALFDDAQLGVFLTHVLAVPLAPTLPTPNARKTCALAIALVQSLRLSRGLLEPCRDRIVYAIRRAIEGELGKEGKKGATSDGLKAVHDLSRHQPSLFAPAFTSILPSILEKLSSPSVALCSQAAHALGGLVLGLANMDDQPPSLLARVSAELTEFITTLSSPKKLSSPPATPCTPEDSSAIVRKLRMTLKHEEPPHPAQGPVWALSVLASFIVLLGPALYTDLKVFKIVHALLQLGLRHKKHAVRALTSALWNPLIAVWLRSRHTEQKKVGDSDDYEEATKATDRGRRLYSALIHSNDAAYRTGTAVIGALLGWNSTSCTYDDLKEMLITFTAMINSGGERADCAVKLLSQLVAPPSNRLRNFGRQFWRSQYEAKLLLPALFSHSPGLLTAEWKSLNAPVSAALFSGPSHEDVRPLSESELNQTWLWDGLMAIWRESISCLEIDEDEGTPLVIVTTWEGLLRAKARTLGGDDRALSEFAETCSTTLSGILTDKSVDLRTSSAKPIETATASTSSKETGDPYAVKLMLLRDLWNVVSAIFGSNANAGLNNMLDTLVWNEPILVPTTAADSLAACNWTMACANVAKHSDGDLPRKFFDNDWEWTTEKQSYVWRCYSEYWRLDKGTWEGAVALLGVPFDNRNSWDMLDRDLSEWDALLQYAIATGFDRGISSAAVLEKVTNSIERRHLITLTASTQVADLLLSNLDLSTDNESELPHALVDIVHDILVAKYPPEPRNKVVSLWLIRSLRSVIDKCPVNLLIVLLEAMQDGLCAWITDECDAFSLDEHSRDLVPLYQTILVALQSLPPSVPVLESLSSIFSAPLLGALTDGQEALEAFREFWENSCLSLNAPVHGWSEGIATALARLREYRGYPQSLRAEPRRLETSAVEEEYERASFLARASKDDRLEYPDSDDDVRPDKRPLTRASGGTSGSSPTSNQEVFVAEEPALPFEGIVSLFTHMTKSYPDNPQSPIASRIPTTPRKAVAKFSTPSRPAKSLSAPPATQFLSIGSPRSPSNTRSASIRRSRSRTVSSSSRLPKVEKENAAPLDASPESSPTQHAELSRSVLGKRAMSFGAAMFGSDAKKRKVVEDENPFARPGPLVPLASSSKAEESDSDEDRRTVHASLFAEEKVTEPAKMTVASSPERESVVAVSRDYQTKVHSTSGTSALPTSSSASEITRATPTRKRKRMIIDAVELPTLQQVICQRRSSGRSDLEMEHVSTPPLTRSQSSAGPRRVFGRTRSQTKRGLTTLAESLAPEPRKRRKIRGNSTAEVEEPIVSGSRLPLSEEDAQLDLPGSDDSFMSYAETSDSAPDSSSDEDFSAGLGQVTPHHLVSPQLRRVSARNDDPASDDSIVSNSPSREHVARRLEKSSSFTWASATQQQPSSSSIIT